MRERGVFSIYSAENVSDPVGAVLEVNVSAGILAKTWAQLGGPLVADSSVSNLDFFSIDELGEKIEAGVGSEQ